MINVASDLSACPFKSYDATRQALLKRLQAAADGLDEIGVLDAYKHQLQALAPGADLCWGVADLKVAVAEVETALKFYKGLRN